MCADCDDAESVFASCECRGRGAGCAVHQWQLLEARSVSLPGDCGTLARVYWCAHTATKLPVKFCLCPGTTRPGPRRLGTTRRDGGRGEVCCVAR